MVHTRWGEGMGGPGRAAYSFVFTVTCVIQRQLFLKKGLRLEGEKGLWARSRGKAAAGHRGMKQRLVQEAGATGASQPWGWHLSHSEQGGVVSCVVWRTTLRVGRRM